VHLLHDLRSSLYLASTMLGSVSLSLSGREVENGLSSEESEVSKFGILAIVFCSLTDTTRGRLFNDFRCVVGDGFINHLNILETNLSGYSPI